MPDCFVNGETLNIRFTIALFTRAIRVYYNSLGNSLFFRLGLTKKIVIAIPAKGWEKQSQYLNLYHSDMLTDKLPVLKNIRWAYFKAF